MRTTNNISDIKLLVPKLESSHVFRERLIDILHNNIQKRLQVISAPAGYGKTTLLTDFVRNIDIPVCWYSISIDDEDPKLFLEGILSSISARLTTFSKLTASCLTTSNDIAKDANHILTTMANEIKNTIPDYLLIAFDDYHVIENSQTAKNILNLLLEKMPENCHFVISSRTQIELPEISKLILENQVSTLKMSNLSFTTDEIKCLAATCVGKNLTDEDTKRLAEETGGWVISLLLHLNDIGVPVLPEVNQDQVFSYMTAEVFLKQPEEIQRFLLASSTTNTISPELTEQLVPDVNYYKTIKYLKQKNLFLQCVNEKKRYYRYHQLFRDFLQEKLIQDDLAEFKLLHLKAAALYEKDGHLNEAIEHYHRSTRNSDIARLIRENGSETLKTGKWIMMQRWLNMLPLNLRITDPELVLLNAQCLIHLGDTNQSQGILTDLLDKRLSKDEWLLRSKALSWRSAAFRLSGYFNEAKSDISTAIQLLKEHQGPPELFGAFYRKLGDIYKDQGQFSSSLKNLQLAQKYYASCFDIGALSIVHNSLGVIYKRLGQLTRAKMHFEKARIGFIKTNNFGELASTLNNIGIICQRFGQYDLALDVYHSGFEKAKESGYLRAEGVIKISIGDVLRDLCRYNEALENYKEGIELSQQSMEPTFISYATAGIGETYRILGQLDKAKILLEEARHQAEDQKQPYEVALFDIQLGIIAYENGQLEQAKRILGDAYNRLQVIGDKDALAKTSFHLAQTSFLSREFDISAEWLEKTSTLADELGYDSFLVVEGRKTLPLIYQGITLKIGDGRFVRILEKIKSIKEPKQTEIMADTPNNPDLKIEYDIRVKALGVIEVLINHRQVKDSDWRSNRAKEVFYYLLTHPKGETSEQISTSLWPDLSPAKGNSNFHINLFRARQALFPGIFITENGRYKINPNIRIWFDVTEFEWSISLVNKKNQGNKEDIVFEYAIELYGGPFLAEFYTDWVEDRRRDLENAYLRILSQSAEINAKQGNYSVAISLLEKYIAIDPYQEDIYYRIMNLHLAVNNKPSALRIYKQYLDSLSGQEVKASSEIENLYKQLII
jgi:LuxR family transcriptional regulator, maltose regulon positive regulatory protein